MSFLTHQIPKDALKMLKTEQKSYFCENRVNKAMNDSLGTYINNISHKYSSHIIIWTQIMF